ncbi:type VI secretion system membrane subunit TssM, partial [Rubrivivax gelatinosus]|nr:type VI secretion system membrane subunit TssM [Rubrivivax gelatinosus]
AVVVPPAETEVNRVWAAQVSEPFQRTLASKYPFDTRSTVEAAPQDIAKIFGPDGAIAKFSNEALGPLVVRRGDAIEPRQWAEVGVRLRPEFTGGFGSWVAQLDAASGGGVTTASSGGAVAAAADQTLFQILPQGAPGFVEYTVVIDGQSLRYRNAAAQWTDMVWPNRAGVAGARLSGVTHDGKTVEFVNEPGNSGLGRFMELAQKKRLDGGVNELKWTQGRYSVTVHLRVLRQPGEPPPPSSRAATAPGTAPIGTSRLQGLRLPTLVAGVDATAAAASSPKASP